MDNEISKLTDRNFARYFEKALAAILEDPINNFIRHEKFMSFKPTPAQTVALKTVFGKPLDPITLHEIKEEVTIKLDDGNTTFGLNTVLKTEVQIYELMTGFEYDGDLIKARNRINLIIGRRGGKTTLSAMMAIYFAIKTNWRPFLTKTPSATVAILSHTVDLSQEILELIKDLVDASPILSRMRDTTKKDTQTTFNLRVPFLEKDEIVWSRVTVKVGAASKKTIRGRAICALLCDEIAFWNLDESAAEKDEDILRAARPSLLQFKEHSVLLKLSSPGIKQGILYSEWEKRFSLPDSYISFKAPSWVWNTILGEREFKEEYDVDPVGFGTEYRADFVDSISNFILPEFVDLCTIRGVKFLTPEKSANMMYSAAIDAAFKGDRFTFSLVGYDGTRIKQFVMQAWEGNRKNPVKATEVAQYIRNVCKQYGISQVHADQYSFQPLREIFDQFGITLIEQTFSPKFKKQIYFNLKKIIHNQQIDLLDHPIMLTEIKQLQVEQTTTGLVRIGHPPGGHDDCADSLAIASYLCVEAMGKAGIDVGEIAQGGDRYGIAVDISGRAFKAPSPEMLGEQILGTPVYDNSHEYGLDPVTGEWKHISQIADASEEDEDEGANENGADFIW